MPWKMSLWNSIKAIFIPFLDIMVQERVLWLIFCQEYTNLQKEICIGSEKTTDWSEDKKIIC